MKNIFCVSIGVLVLVVFGCKRNTSNDTDGDYPVWIEMMEQPSVEMSKARQSFDTYWEKNNHYKGDRCKQFERWYAINSKRLDKYGKVISSAQVSSEFQKLRTKSGAAQQGNWFNYGPINVGPRNGKKRDGGRVKDIEFHPVDPNIFYVSTFKGGLFKTADYGTSWKAVTDNLTEEVYVCEVSDDNDGVIFIGTNQGVYKTTDGGANWESTSLISKTKALLLKSDNQNIVIAGSDDGIRRSEDGGATWTLVQAASKVEDLDEHPTNAEIMYAATNGNPSEFFRSVDGGKTWLKDTTFGKGCFMGVAVSPAQPDFVYVINLRDHLGDDSFEGFYFSADSGETFTKQSGRTPCISGYKNDGAISRGQPNYNLFVCVDPVNADIVYAGGVKSWKSTDKGKTWTHFYENITSDGDNLHLDQLNWAYSPHDKRIFAVNDGGVYYLGDGNKFQMITDGLPIAEIYECTQSQTVKSNVAGGTMHCGVKLNYHGTWLTPWGGDEATCIIDPTDENYVYHLKYEKISRSSNGGQNFKRINGTNADRGNYTGTGALHKSDPNTLFVGLLQVERTNNARDISVVWKKISAFSGVTKIQKVVQSTANHDVLYVARGNQFYRTDNANADSPVFTDITASLPNSGSVNDIATHPEDESVVYILLGSNIYKSSDKGLNWTNITHDLPAVALLEMIYDNSANEGIYVGTDIGVFYKDSTMNSWIDYSKNLPAVRISGMDIYYGKTRDDSFITISTDGRSFWRSLLYGASTQKLTADFIVDKTSVLVTEKVQITNTTSENQVGTTKWIIEGGNPSVSYKENPEVTFDSPGTYQILLEVTNSAGTSTKSVEVKVDALQVPVPGISADNTTVFAGNAVGFHDESEFLPKSWEWVFEGGKPEFSTEQNPLVVYNTAGSYYVSLKVSNSIGSASKIWEGFITVVENQGTGDLQMRYEFENGLADSSSYKRNLIVQGDYQPDFISDRNGNTESAYQTPGNNDNYLSNSYMGVGGNMERTVTGWFRTTSSGPSRKTIVSWGKNSQGQMFNVMVQDNGNIRVEAGSCNVQSAQSHALNNNEWHHVAVTYNANDGDKLKDVKIYIDGEYVSNHPDSGESYRSEDVSINTDNSTNNVRIGSVNYSDYYWVGHLDDIRIYSKSLSAEEIKLITGTMTGARVMKTGPEIKICSGSKEIRIEIPGVREAEAQIYDIKGSLIAINKLETGINYISLKNGVYIAKVLAGNDLISKKVVCY